MENSVRCVVGFCMNGLVSGVFWGVVGGTFSVVAQLFKFAVVLLLTYSLAMGIFYLWEHDMAGMSGVQMLTQSRQSRVSKQTSPFAHQREGSNLKYPFVVEIPSKVSMDSFNKKKAPKGKEKFNSSLNGRVSLSKEEAVEEVIEQNDFDLQRNLEEEEEPEPDSQPGVSGSVARGSN